MVGLDLPIFLVLLTALGTVVARQQLQTFIPAMPKEWTIPMSLVLLPGISFFFIYAPFLNKPLALVVFLLLLPLPFVQQYARRYSWLWLLGN